MYYRWVKGITGLVSRQAKENQQLEEKAEVEFKISPFHPKANAWTPERGREGLGFRV